MAQKQYINGFSVSLPGTPGAVVAATPIELPRDGFDVEFTRISVTATANGNIVPANCLLQITEQGGQNQAVFVQAQHARNLAGDGSLPWQLAEAYRVNGNLRLSLTVTQLGSSPCDVFVTLHGKRVEPARS